MDVSKIFDDTPTVMSRKRGPAKGSMSDEQRERLRVQLTRGRETALKNRQALAKEREKLKEEVKEKVIPLKVKKERQKLGLDDDSNTEMLNLLRQLVKRETDVKQISVAEEAKPADKVIVQPNPVEKGEQQQLNAHTERVLSPSQSLAPFCEEEPKLEKVIEQPKLLGGGVGGGVVKKFFTIKPNEKEVKPCLDLSKLERFRRRQRENDICHTGF